MQDVIASPNSTICLREPFGYQDLAIKHDIALHRDPTLFRDYSPVAKGANTWRQPDQNLSTVDFDCGARVGRLIFIVSPF